MKQSVLSLFILSTIFLPFLSLQAQELTSETPTISNGAQAYILSQQMEMRGEFENVTHGPDVPLSEPDAAGSFIQACTFDTNAVYNGSYYIPPDNHAAAGSTYVVNVVNALIQVFTKSGTLQYSDDIKGFCTANGFTPLTATFDPKILYDQYSDRWVFVTLEYTDLSSGGSANTSSVIMGCSQTSDPTGSWNIDTINTKINISGTDSWLDYPGFAVDEEAIYVTGNMFSFAASGGIYQGQRTIIMNKNTFYTTGSLSYTIYDPETITGNNFGITYMPAHTFGTVPSGVGTFLIGYSGLASAPNEYAYVIRVDNPLTSPSWTGSLVLLGDIDNPIGMPNAPQSGTATQIETNDRRILDAIWQNNSLYCVTTVVDGSSQASAYWLEINTSTLSTLVLSDDGAIDGEDIATSTHTFFPSIAVDPSGNIGVGFSASGSSIYPGSYFTYRLTGDAAGTMRSSQVVKAGTDYYVRAFGGSRNRWGDYSGTAVDPVDGKIWVYNQYAMTRGTILGGEDGRWSTGYRYFYIAAPFLPSLSSPSNGATGITVPTTLTWNAAFGATVYTVEVSTNASFTNIVNSQSGLTSTTTSVPGLAAGTQYYWRVRAVNPEDSTTSSIWNFTTQGGAPPPAPALVSPTNGSSDESTSPVLSWSASTGADSYTVDVATDVGFSNIVYTQSGIVGTSQQAGVLDGLTLYYWRVTAVNGSGSNTSSAWSFTTFDADVAINYTSGWNILTLPLPVQYNDPDSVFPSRTSQVYGYTSGYYVATALDPEVGYWAQFSSADSVIISGTDKAGPTVSVVSGWNIIGGFDYAVTTASITSTPTGIVQSNFYGYNSGYNIASVLEVGKGYWVKCSQAGTLTLPTGTVPRSTQPFTPEEEWITVTISDNAGNTNSLYLAQGTAESISALLPPIPPKQIFDARFSDDTFIADASGGNMIAVQSSHYPLKISVSGGNLKFTGGTSGQILDKQIRDGESFIISSPAINRLNVNVVEIPMAYELFQNYPNPFNPSTMIKFALPEAGKVTLEIYDQLGQKVETLINQEYEAGYFEYEWNAENYSSGVYFYTITTGNFKSVKKMLLLK